MVYLLLSILSSASVSVVMRFSTGRVKGNISMLSMNYLMCLLLACLFNGSGDLFPAVSGLPAAIGMGIVHGMLYLISFVSLQRNVARNGVVLSATFMKLGLLVPMAVSIFFFRELPSVLQIIGFCIAIGAILLINLKKDHSAVQSPLGLVMLLLTGGAADAMSKVFEQLGDPALSEQFLVYTFAVALLLCVCLMLRKRQQIGISEVGFGLLIGIPNFFSARFLLLALEHVPAVITYPTYSVATILVVTAVGVLCFRERLEKRQWTALVMILAALICLNV